MKKLFFALCIFCNAGLTLAQYPDWKNYTAETEVTGFCEDANFIWVATKSGLMKLDKITYAKTFYNLGNSGLPSNSLTCIAITSTGVLWIGTEYKGLVRFDGTAWTVFNNFNAPFNFDLIRNIAIDGNDNVFVSESFPATIFKFDGISWSTISYIEAIDINLSINSLATEANDLWVGTTCQSGTCTGVGLYHFDGFSWDYFYSGNSSMPQDHVMDIEISGSDKWFITFQNDVDFENGLVKFDGTSWSIFDSTNSPVGPYSTQIEKDATGNIWLVKNTTLFQFNGSTWNVYDSASTGGSVYPQVNQMHGDLDGNLWLGTGIYNLYDLHIDSLLRKYNGTSWSKYNTSNSPLFSNNIIEIIKDQTGNIWVLSNLGLNVFDGTTWTNFEIEFFAPLNESQLVNMDMDQEGRVWVMYHDNGYNYLFKIFDGTSWVDFPWGIPGFGTDFYYDFVVDHDHNPWLISNNFYCLGAVRLDSVSGSQTSTYGLGMLPNCVSLIEIDSLGRIWFGIEDSLAIFDGTSWNYVSTASTGFNFDQFYDLYFDSPTSGYGTFNGGVARFVDTSWSLLPGAPFGINPFELALDSTDKFWFPSFEGLYQFNWIEWDLLDSLAPSNSNFWANSICVDDSNKKWLGCSNDDEGGLMVYAGYGNLIMPGLITGFVFNDLNGNSLQDIGEPGLQGKIVQAGPYFGSTDHSGFYQIFAPVGSYVVQAATILYGSISPATHSANLLTPGMIDSLNNFGVVYTPGVRDLKVLLTAGPFRPGFDGLYWLTLKNIGTTIESGSAALNFDNLVGFLSSNVTPSSLIGGTVLWNYSGFEMNEMKMMSTIFQVPSTIGIGTGLQSNGMILPVSSDADLSNNYDTINHFTQGSFDPNMKLVFPEGAGADGFVEPDSLTLEYTIFFQNTGTDTAFTIIIRDTMDSDLDVSTFNFLGASFLPCTFKVYGTGIFEFTLQNIQLPDSNINEPGSHGFIKYSIKPKPGLALGTQLANTAFIYFDFNAPIATNTTMNTLGITGIETNPSRNSQAMVFPNPVGSSFTVKISEPGLNFELFNVVGQKLISRNLNAEFNRFDIPHFSNGLYFWKITGPDSELLDSGKLIKVKD